MPNPTSEPSQLSQYAPDFPARPVESPRGDTELRCDWPLRGFVSDCLCAMEHVGEHGIAACRQAQGAAPIAQRRFYGLPQVLVVFPQTVATRCEGHCLRELIEPPGQQSKRLDAVKMEIAIPARSRRILQVCYGDLTGIL